VRVPLYTQRVHRVFSISAVATVACALISLPIRGETKIKEAPYHGWNQAFVMDNGMVEIVVVPEIGRVMQFRFRGEETGPFWENRALDGKSPNPQSVEWINFGGDKTWPAPQGEWAKITGRGWPPPKAFDSMPVEGEIQGGVLSLKSKVDPNYGIRTERRIKLHETTSEMEIETIYEKVEGPPVRVSIWVISQLKNPEKVFMAAEQYNKQSTALPANLKVENGMISCTRSPRDSTKIGSNSGDLFWADARWLLHIHAPRENEKEFPDNGSSAEIYTNPDPNSYIELETLGPLHELKRGDTLARKQTYRLYRRSARPLDQQVRDLLRK
jgi:hypothetical protein